MWRPGLILYGIALPLVWMSFFLFYTTDMSKDIHCTLAGLGDSGKENPYYSINGTAAIQPVLPETSVTMFMKNCLNPLTPALEVTLTDEAGYRWPIYQMGLWIPVIYSIIEMGLNKLLLRFRHVIIVVIVCILYMGVNFLGTIMYGNKPVYANVVVWPDSELLPGRNYWNSLGLFCCVWCIGTPIVFLLFVVIHRYKFVCCKGD